MFLTTNLKTSFFLTFISCLLLVPSNIWAHNPSHSSTMLVEGENNEWTLLISSSLTAFQHEIRKKYSVDSYKTPEEFKKLVIKHLLESISIICDTNKDIKLEKLAIKLGHGTKVSFKILGIPKEFNSITVKNTSFENLSSNKSALIILKKGIKKEQFILNRENNHKIDLLIKNDKFEILSKRIENNNYALWVSLVVVVLVLLVVFRNKLNFKKTNYGKFKIS